MSNTLQRWKISHQWEKPTLFLPKVYIMGFFPSRLFNVVSWPCTPLTWKVIKTIFCRRKIYTYPFLLFRDCGMKTQSLQQLEKLSYICVLSLCSSRTSHFIDVSLYCCRRICFAFTYASGFFIKYNSSKCKNISNQSDKIILDHTCIVKTQLIYRIVALF